jgi:hypothetical protein
VALVGYDVSRYPFDPILRVDKKKNDLVSSNLRMGSTGCPETSYLSYNIKPPHDPKELQHQFHCGESLRSHFEELLDSRCASGTKKNCVISKTRICHTKVAKGGDK